MQTIFICQMLLLILVEIESVIGNRSSLMSYVIERLNPFLLRIYICLVTFKEHFILGSLWNGCWASSYKTRSHPNMSGISETCDIVLWTLLSQMLHDIRYHALHLLLGRCEGQTLRLVLFLHCVSSTTRFHPFSVGIPIIAIRRWVSWPLYQNDVNRVFINTGPGGLQE